MRDAGEKAKKRNTSNQPKKIAIDARMWGAEFTGIGNYLQEITTRLFRLLPEHEFLLFVTPDKKTELAFPQSVETISAPEKIYSLAEQASFYRKLRIAGADLTWFPHFNVPILFQQKFVATIHDLTILKYPGKKMNRLWHQKGYRMILNHTLAASRKIITVSEFTRQEVIGFAGKYDQKTVAIPNGVEVQLYANPEAECVAKMRKRFDSPIFLVTGVWREHKNIPGAIRAFELFRRHGGKGTLVITGREDPFYPEVPRLAKSSAFASDIILTGFLPENEKIALFTIADALVFPSFAEGFGLPALEAMAAGTPVICSKASSLPEVCADAALYFDPSDPEDIALKMVDVLEEDARAKLIAKGRARVTDFSWDTAAKATAEVLCDALND